MFKMERIYIDMDMVICDFKKLHAAEVTQDNEYPHARQGFFNELEEIKDAVKSVKSLMDEYDVHILTAPSYMNPHCYTDKRLWIERHFGMEFCKKLIISYDKSLLIGDYLIDDSLNNKQLLFSGELIHFGTIDYPDWATVLRYFKNK